MLTLAITALDTATTAVNATQLSGTTNPGDMSFLGLFMQADVMVKLVMVGLMLASVWAWTIIFEKSNLINRVQRGAKGFEDVFWASNSLEQLYERLQSRTNDPMVVLFVTGMREWQTAIKRGAALSVPAVAEALQVRVGQAMQNAISREMGKLESRMTFLASLGSSAPFIGLFGTVWGIMRSFIAIAATDNTSLNIVAPAIAEALLATGMGLVAAVPAVLAYNKYASDFGKYASRLEAFTADFQLILSRNLYDGAGGQIPARPADAPAGAPTGAGSTLERRYGT
jgi:biopolymer transport protein TolQ